MGQKLPPREEELYRRCDEVLHYVWDPIGVAGAPGARDEYHAYLPSVFAQLCDGAGATQIARYLLGIEQRNLSLAGSIERAQAAADSLLAWREWIWARAE